MNELIDIPFTIENIGHYRIDWKKIRSCTLKQKEKLVPFIQNLIALEKQIMIEGSAALNSFIDTINDPFEKNGIFLLLHNFDFEMISTILYNFVSATDLPNEKYLEYVIFIRYVLEEKKGHHSISVLDILLTSYLGPEFIRPFFCLDRAEN